MIKLVHNSPMLLLNCKLTDKRSLYLLWATFEWKPLSLALCKRKVNVHKNLIGPAKLNLMSLYNNIGCKKHLLGILILPPGRNACPFQGYPSYMSLVPIHTTRLRETKWSKVSWIEAEKYNDKAWSFNYLSIYLLFGVNRSTTLYLQM